MQSRNHLRQHPSTPTSRCSSLPASTPQQPHPFSADSITHPERIRSDQAEQDVCNNRHNRSKQSKHSAPTRVLLGRRARRTRSAWKHGSSVVEFGACERVPKAEYPVADRTRSRNRPRLLLHNSNLAVCIAPTCTYASQFLGLTVVPSHLRPKTWNLTLDKYVSRGPE
jgi:hypothetical protein